MKFIYRTEEKEVFLHGKMEKHEVAFITEVVDGEGSIVIPIRIDGHYVYSFTDVRGLDNISAIITEDRHPFMRSIDGVLFSRDRKTLICYPPKKAEPVYSMPSQVEFVHSRAFRYCTYLTVLIFSPNISSLESDVVYNCRCLKSATLPSAVKELSGFPFANCERLLNLTLPGNINKLNLTAYINSNMKALFVPRSVTEFDFDPTLISGEIKNKIFCSENAPVIQWCEKYNIPYKVVQSGIPRNDNLDLPMNTSNL